MSDIFCEYKISAIIPVYNGAIYLPTILEALSVQTLQGFEVLFVNDGSRDDTAEVLNGLYGRNLPFECTVIHQQNAGVSAARNTGLRAAKGKYVSFIDVDDTIAPDYLEVLYNAIQSTGCRVAVAHITREEQQLFERQEQKVGVLSSGDFLKQFLYKGIEYSICACMFDKNCFTDHQLFFPEGYRYSEDVFVLWQIFAAENRIAESNRKLYYYYDNPFSAMNNGIDLRRLDAIKLMQQLEPIIEKLNPEFSPEFDRYAVARHHWSILWQAATRLASYKEFIEYCSHFRMEQQLRKLYTYPEKRISWSSRLYCFSKYLYYVSLRLYVMLLEK